MKLKLAGTGLFALVLLLLAGVAQAEVPLPYNRTLEQMALPKVEDVVRAVKEVL